MSDTAKEETLAAKSKVLEALLTTGMTPQAHEHFENACNALRAWAERMGPVAPYAMCLVGAELTLAMKAPAIKTDLNSIDIPQEKP